MLTVINTHLDVRITAWSLKHLYSLECSELNDNVVDNISDVGDKCDESPARDDNAINDCDNTLDTGDTGSGSPLIMVAHATRT